MAEAPFKHLTVVGAGLLGGSFLMAARESYPELWIQAVDTSEDALQFLLKNHLADQVSRTLPTSFEPDHLIVLASHLKSSMDYLKTLAPIIREQDIMVTDIGSCKRAICALGEDLLPEHFVGGHPLAGKEFSGVQNATALLFATKPYAFCLPKAYETSEIFQHRFARLETFVREGLRADTGSIDPESHDRYMAFVSHFPQLYALMLTNLLHRNEPGRLLMFHGAGIDDQLRLGASPYAMWREVFELNEDNLREVLQKFALMMREASDTLNTPEMENWFERAHEIHHEFHNFRLNQSFPHHVGASSQKPD